MEILGCSVEQFLVLGGSGFCWFGSLAFQVVFLKVAGSFLGVLKSYIFLLALVIFGHLFFICLQRYILENFPMFSSIIGKFVSCYKNGREKRGGPFLSSYNGILFHG